jgi:surfeit locus 1 family protein
LKRALLLCLALIGVLGFAALGVWQVERLAWKRALIARVEARIHATPSALPSPATWSAITDRDAYRRIRVTGTFDHAAETLVKAVTEQGDGFWVVTPLRTAQGVVLINRGFVPGDRRAPASRSAGQLAGPVTVTGLLRITEPGGAFLRSNDPAADRWYSRDVAAIARARGLGKIAPFFIDADATPNLGGYPIGGLTVVRFSDNHLVYALTWFGLALLCAFAAWQVVRQRSDA